MSSNTSTSVCDPFSPFQLGPITLRNRFIKSGANEGMCYEGAPSKALLKHHRDLAAGGVALTTVAYGAVAKEGRTLDNQIWIRREVLPDMKAMADAVHAEGGKISFQITHGGSFVTMCKVKGRTMSSMSGFNPAGSMAGNFFQRAMNEEDMDRVANEFASAAELCREAGFDAVEIHMGHGYMLNQFISPLSNKRTDQYGGNAENRARFPAMVLKRVKEAVGKDLAVTVGKNVRIRAGGRNIESTWFILGSNLNVEEMERVLHDRWFLRTMMKLSQRFAPKVEFKEMYFLDYSRKIRAALDMPLAYLGGTKSMDNVEIAMRDGFECVVMARALIHDTALINKFKEGTLRHSGCTSCNSCVAYIYDPAGTRCVENPPNELKLNQVRASAG